MTCTARRRKWGPTVLRTVPGEHQELPITDCVGAGLEGRPYTTHSELYELLSLRKSEKAAVRQARD
jgi:hypothetical protein